jgi:hypothetical protein
MNVEGLESEVAACARRIRPRSRELLRVLLSTFGEDAVAIGAPRAALRQRA